MTTKKRLFFDKQSMEMADKFGVKEKQAILTDEGLKYFSSPFAVTGGLTEGAIVNTGEGGINSGMDLHEDVVNGGIKTSASDNGGFLQSPLFISSGKDIIVTSDDDVLVDDDGTIYKKNDQGTFEIINTMEDQYKDSGSYTTGGGGGGGVGTTGGGGGGGMWEPEPEGEPIQQDDITGVVIGGIILVLLIFFGYNKGGKK